MSNFTPNKFRRMPATLIRTVTAGCLAATILQLNAQSDPLTGTWRTVTERLDDGTDYNVYFQLKQTSSEISVA